LCKLIHTPDNQGEWKQLLVGADDHEVAQTYSQYYQNHALEKASLVVITVRVLYKKQRETFPLPGNRQSVSSLFASQASMVNNIRLVPWNLLQFRYWCQSKHNVGPLFQTRWTRKYAEGFKVAIQPRRGLGDSVQELDMIQCQAPYRSEVHGMDLMSNC
jgi:hypothetical protein